MPCTVILVVVVTVVAVIIHCRERQLKFLNLLISNTIENFTNVIENKLNIDNNKSGGRRYHKKQR